MTIMKNRITTTITTMMLMLFSYGINVFAQSENVVPSGHPELDEWVKQCKVERPNALGYPGNYDSKLDSFYDWYTQNKMENILINNAGDPFGNPCNNVYRLIPYSSILRYSVVSPILSSLAVSWYRGH